MQDYEQLSTLYETNLTKILKVRRKTDNKLLVSKQLNYGQMPEKAKHQLVSEVNILRELKHPNIVRYYEYSIDKSSQIINIIMEYCENGDLASKISNAKKMANFFPEEAIWKIFTQISLALHEIHRRKEGLILHRDLKPANIFLDHHDNAKLGDFGLSKILDECTDFACTKAGTLHYMSPEFLNEGKYTEKSEIWAIGCILYELCCLNKPFEASNELALALKIRDKKIEPISNKYSSELRRVITWCLAYNQKERPNVEDLLNIPEISKRLREKRLKENHMILKKKEEEIALKEQELKMMEENLRRREQNLAEEEEKIKEKNKKNDSFKFAEKEREKGTARFDELNAKTLNQKIRLLSTGLKTMKMEEDLFANNEAMKTGFIKRHSDILKGEEGNSRNFQYFNSNKKVNNI